MDKNILSALRSYLLTRSSLTAIPDSVWKRTGALNTWGTNAIEGNTLTWEDVRRLLLEDRSVADRPVPDVLETLQHQTAFRGLLRRCPLPLRLTVPVELHEEVFRGVKPDAGVWRRVNVRITGTAFQPPRMEKVVPLMEDWVVRCTRRETAGTDVFELGAESHHGFESVHPFSDGNGRVGRLLLNLHFLRHNWPPVHILPPDRDRYLDALESGHRGDLGPLRELLRVQMASSLLDFLEQVGTAEDELHPLKRLARFSKHSAKYLALRIGQGRLPGIKAKGDWQTSRRALGLYADMVGR